MNKPVMTVKDLVKEALAAESRIRPCIRETPLEYSLYLSNLGDCRAYLKLENVQITGSFKLRGAANKLLSLSEGEKMRGAVTASSGNHGTAFAHMTNHLEMRGTVVLPKNASPVKIEALRSLGAEAVLFGEDCIDAERRGRQLAEERGAVYVPPYNDPLIIGGQATIGIEIHNRLKDVDVIIVPVGGGGLMAGAGGYLKTVNRSVFAVAAQPEHSCVMYESIKAGRILDIPSRPTLSDGSAGGIEPGSITFPLCRDIIDDFILLREEEIASAVRFMLEIHALLVEGAGALPVAAFRKYPERYAGRTVVMVVSGGRISPDVLRNLL